MATAIALETATEVIDRSSVRLTGTFTPAQLQDVVIPAQANDKMRVRHAPGVSATLRQVAILPDCAMLGHVGAVLRASDGALLSAGRSGPPNWNFAKPRRLRSRRFGEGLVTSLQDIHHYYHFFERILGLIGYLDHEHPRGSPLTVLVRAGGPAFQRRTCEAIAAAYPGVTFTELGKDERAEIACYLWLHDLCDNVEWLPVTRERAGRLSAILRDHYRQPAPSGGELLFFSRGNTKQRRLTTEAELEAIAAERGFRRFVAVSDNHPEQVRRFANADVIVSVHGAGLTNLLFARPGTMVVEMFPEGCLKSTYLWLSNRLGLRHHPLLGGPGDYHHTFAVAPEAFAVRLDEVLSQAAQSRSSAA